MSAEEARFAIARQWLLSAGEDLTLGHRGMEEPALPRGAVFHAQQVAEKALKAFLIFHDQPFKRTHDLIELLNLCISVQPDFAALEDMAQILTPYAIAGRYPDAAGGLVPMLAQAEDALRDAEAVLEFVLQRLPPTARP